MEKYWFKRKYTEMHINVLNFKKTSTNIWNCLKSNNKKKKKITHSKDPAIEKNIKKCIGNVANPISKKKKKTPDFKYLKIAGKLKKCIRNVVNPIY